MEIILSSELLEANNPISGHSVLEEHYRREHLDLQLLHEEGGLLRI